MVQKLALNLRFIGLQISTSSLALAICQCQQDKLRICGKGIKKFIISLSLNQNLGHLGCVEEGRQAAWPLLVSSLCDSNLRFQMRRTTTTEDLMW